MTINVTAEHIRDGEQRVPNKCAVALALREALPGRLLYVYSDAYEDVTAGRRYEFPDVARLFFVTDPQKRKPFAFEVEGPESAVSDRGAAAT